MCKVTPKREGFFRLGVGGSCEPNPEQYPDVTPQERKINNLINLLLREENKRR